jgi:multiple sugar transport system permease protein
VGLPLANLVGGATYGPRANSVARLFPGDVVKRRNEYMIFIAPALITLVIVVIFPTAFLYYVSLTNYDLSAGWAVKRFIGLGNYFFLLFQDSLFWKSLGLTVLFVLTTVSIELVLGMLIALGLGRLQLSRRLILAIIIIPMVCTPSIIGLMWKLILNTEYGVANYLLGLAGLAKVNWLGVQSAFASVVLVDLWQWTPFMVLMLHAALQSLPLEPFEAARMDGANAVQMFFGITLPMISRLVLIALILRLIDSIKVFDIIYCLTQGGPGTATELLSLRIYRIGFQHSNMVGRASAYAVIMIMALSPLFARLSGLLNRNAK